MFRVAVVVIILFLIVVDAFCVSFVVWACLALLFCVEQTRIPCYNPHSLHVCLAPTQRMWHTRKNTRTDRTEDSI